MPMATATAIMLGLGVGGQVLNFFGRRSATKDKQKALEFNAKVAEMQAVDALARGAEDEERFRMVVKGLIGSQRAGFAGQNVDVGIGSPVDVVADSAYLGELDALTIRNNAAREAWGYRVQAENFRMGVDAAGRANNFATASSLLGFGSSLLALRYGFGGGGGTLPNMGGNTRIWTPGQLPPPVMAFGGR